MAIKKWKEPYYEFQKGENKRAYHYFKKYKKFNGNLTDFQRHLEQLWQKNNQNLAEIFHAYDIKKGESPSYDVLMGWRKKFDWEERKDLYDLEFERDIANSLKKKYINGLSEDFDKALEFKELNLDAAIKESKSGKLTPSGAESRAKANSMLQADVRVVIGETNEITDNKHIIDGNLNASVDVKRNLSEDMILNPKYAELTKQLREDVLNGRTDSSEDS